MERDFSDMLSELSAARADFLVVPCGSIFAGVDFEDAWKEREVISVSGVDLPVVSHRHLLQNKRSTGRPKDAADAAWLEAHPPQQQK